MKDSKKAVFKMIGERNISLHISNLDQHERIAQIARALSNVPRLRMLNILKDTVMNVQEIAETLKLPLSTTAQHIRVLEEAGLIITQPQPGIHGSMRVCTCSIHSFSLKTYDAEHFAPQKAITVDMPIGSYSACDIQPTCGLANEKGIIDAYDNARTFYFPQRSTAQLIWFHQGYIEYRFPNICNPLLPLQEISFSLELCSEAPGYLENWPSDITVSVNGCEVATYTAPGDFGARRGNLTPNIWPNGSTQYGMLKLFSVKNDGAYLDGVCVNRQLTIPQLKLEENAYIVFRVEVKKDSKHVGGVNLFGEKYGDYPQGIVMQLAY